MGGSRRPEQHRSHGKPSKNHRKEDPCMRPGGVLGFGYGRNALNPSLNFKLLLELIFAPWRVRRLPLLQTHGTAPLKQTCKHEAGSEEHCWHWQRPQTDAAAVFGCTNKLGALEPYRLRLRLRTRKPLYSSEPPFSFCSWAPTVSQRVRPQNLHPKSPTPST